MATLPEVYAEETHESTFSVRIAAGEHTFVGDEPHDQGGADLGPSPFSFLAAALAECTVMTVRWYAQKNQMPVEHIAAQVTRKPADSSSQTPNLNVYHKVIHIRGSALTCVQRAKLVSVAAKCPVQRLLEQGCTVTTEEGVHS